MKTFLAGVFVGALVATLVLAGQLPGERLASDKVVEPQVVVENTKVKIVRWVLRPGEGTPMHTHTLDHVSVVIHGSSTKDVDASGATKEREQKTGSATFVPGTGLTHSFANTGAETFESVAIELK